MAVVRLWNIRRPVRTAAVILLLVWVGPVSFVQTDSWRLLRWAGAPGRASAESQVIPAGMAMVLEPKTLLKLHLRDGSVIEGRFLRRTLLDSALYAPRFAAKAGSSTYVPFALGETLHVSLRDGREWTAPFAGYGELTLLLKGPDGPNLRVPFELAGEIRRPNGNRIEPSDLAKAFRAGLLPSAEALELQQQRRTYGMADPWRHTLRVAVEDIERATAELSPGTNVAGVIVLTVIVGVVLGFVLFAVALNAAFKKGCKGPDIGPTRWPSAVHLTTRPFDPSRGCYVGDELAVGDLWPGSTESRATDGIASLDVEREGSR